MKLIFRINKCYFLFIFKFFTRTFISINKIKSLIFYYIKCKIPKSTSVDIFLLIVQHSIDNFLLKCRKQSSARKSQFLKFKVTVSCCAFIRCSHVGATKKHPQKILIKSWDNFFICGRFFWINYMNLLMGLLPSLAEIN
jgi:hypothetical protein